MVKQLTKAIEPMKPFARIILFSYMALVAAGEDRTNKEV